MLTSDTLVRCIALKNQHIHVIYPRHHILERIIGASDARFIIADISVRANFYNTKSEFNRFFLRIDLW
jgi:hypothetical protein